MEFRELGIIDHGNELIGQEAEMVLGKIQALQVPELRNGLWELCDRVSSEAEDGLVLEIEDGCGDSLEVVAGQVEPQRRAPLFKRHTDGDHWDTRKIGQRFDGGV